MNFFLIVCLQASDNMSRLEESLVKCIVTSLVKDVAQTDKHRLLNPNEVCIYILQIYYTDYNMHFSFIIYYILL